jgi:Kef-type K+ transport system membrane component KefB
MGNSSSNEPFFESASEFIIASVVMILGYLFRPIELIEKYKYAMPNEVESLFLSTGIQIFLVYTLIKLIKNGNYKDSSFNKSIVALFSVNILSIIFLYYTVYALQVEFLNRHDPLFNYFFINYLFYAFIYFGLILLISWIRHRLFLPNH